MSARAMAEATGGVWRGTPPPEVAGFSIDSRRLRPGEAFVALCGPNHDGHRYAADVVGRASALIGARDRAEGWRMLPVPQLLVEEGASALRALAARHRRDCRVERVIAVVGSQGKTTVRTLLAHLLSIDPWRVHQTEGNRNNLIGTPLTLLAIPRAAQAAVVECGISERGEMAELAAMVAPDLVVVPAISSGHSAGLGTLEEIVREKGIMLQRGCPDLFLGRGVAALLDHAGVRTEGAMLQAEDVSAVQAVLRGGRLLLCQGDGQAALDLPLPSTALAENMALAATVARRLRPELTLERIARRLEGWRPPAGRLRAMRGLGGARIIDDSYNANPASMAAALALLAALPGRRIAVLGEMAELGDDSAAAHAALPLAGIDRVLLFGAEMAPLAGRWPQAEWFAAFADLADAVGQMARGLGPDDSVLLKGSRCNRLERLLPLLAPEGADAL